MKSIKEIYGQATVYMKAPVYETFSQPPLGIFSLIDKHEHAKRRRLLAHAFSQANLYDTEPLILEKIDKVVAKTQTSKSQPVNVLWLFRALALDIVGELFLGQPFGALDQETPLPYLEDVDRSFLIGGLEANFPLPRKVLSRVPLPQIQHFFDSKRRLYKYGNDAFLDYIKRNGRKSARKDLLTKILVPSASGETPMTDEETHAEISNLVFAGTDTTIPATGGQLCGYFVPSKTIVSMQCYTTQRDPKVFSNPDTFAPDRWLAKPGATDEMKAMFMPFSKGSRACLGIHLAMMELKLTTAALVRDQSVTIARSIKTSDMDMKDHFLVLPAGSKCELVFTADDKS